MENLRPGNHAVGYLRCRTRDRLALYRRSQVVGLSGGSDGDSDGASAAHCIAVVVVDVILVL